MVETLWSDAANAPLVLDSVVLDELLGVPVPTPRQVLEDLAALSPGALAAELGEMLRSALYVLPEGVELPEAGHDPVPAWSADRVAGKVLSPTRARRAEVGQACFFI